MDIDETRYQIQTFYSVKPQTFMDFCSGIGGGRLGLENNGLKCVGFSEIDLTAEETYRLLHDTENEKNFGDLTKISPHTLPHFDIMIAGFPCQAFSIMGEQQGFADKRGQIIYYLVDILRAKKTPYFILENVKGLLTHDKGRTLKLILAILEEAGYKVFYEVLNSLNYGVPQMRERVYFVGIRKDIAKKNTFKWPVQQETPCISKYLIANDNEISPPVKRWLNKYNNNKYNNGKYDFVQIAKSEFQVIDTRQSDLRLYDKKIPTLRASRQGVMYIKDGKYRAITGIEGLLLQGFSQEYVEKVNSKVSNSTLLFQVGNAMTVTVIDAIYKSLLEYLGVDNE